MHFFMQVISLTEDKMAHFPFKSKGKDYEFQYNLLINCRYNVFEPCKNQRTFNYVQIMMLFSLNFVQKVTFLPAINGNNCII